MTSQILLFARPELSVIIEMTGHFFSLNNWKRVFKFVRDTLEALEIVRTTFKPGLISLLLII